jgi:hypothetical protein
MRAVGGAPLGVAATGTGTVRPSWVGVAALGLATSGAVDLGQRLAQEDGFHVLLESGAQLLLE